MTQSELLDRLEADLRALLETIRAELLVLDDATLRRRPAEPKRWNMLECFDHLNRSYSDYLDYIELAIHKAKARQWQAEPMTKVRYSLLGSEALRWVKLGNNKQFKTSKRYNPLGKEVSSMAVKSFVINAERLLRMIQSAREVDINQARVRFAIVPLMHYRLGNLLEFMVVHAQRHTAQAQQLRKEQA